MPSEVEFHTGLTDKLGFACRLLRKAWRKGLAGVAVTGDPRALGELDTALWTFEPLEFVPHARLARDAAVPPRLARTPLWLLDPGARGPHHEVLVNLGPEMPEGFGEYERLIEVVSSDAADREAGRRRWRRYEAEGLPIKHHHAAG